MRDWEPVEKAEFKRTIPAPRWGFSVPIKRKRNWKAVSSYKDSDLSSLNADEKVTVEPQVGSADTSAMAAT
jgi:hypothetical protein